MNIGINLQAKSNIKDLTIIPRARHNVPVMKPNEFKTNVMRILDAAHISYRHYSYADTPALSGVDVAAVLQQNPHQVFKTLVTVARSNKYYVFMLPVCGALDLKKAAAAVGEKSLSMLPQRELLGLTGYVHGGCSPIGMKKQFQTVIDTSAQTFPTIIFSAGKIGYQVDVAPSDIAQIIPLCFADICALSIDGDYD